MPGIRKYRRDTSEVSCCLKYVIFGVNVLFWVSTSIILAMMKTANVLFIATLWILRYNRLYFSFRECIVPNQRVQFKANKNKKESSYTVLRIKNDSISIFTQVLSSQCVTFFFCLGVLKWGHLNNSNSTWRYTSSILESWN